MGCGHGTEALDYAGIRMAEAADEIERLTARITELEMEIDTLTKEIYARD